MTQTARRLLLVDDDERNLKLLKVRLHPLGHELLVAHDGHAAIAAFEEMRPDLVLLDVVMPGLDGLEVLKHIRRSDHDMHVPVILVTGHSERDQRLRGLQAGADEFLEKPIDGPILLARVKTLLALKESRDALQATLASLAVRNETLERMRREQRELTQFVVHDLKSPLMAVCTNLQWILQSMTRLEPTELIESLKDANEAGERLTSMIEDLLRIATLEESSKVVRPELFPLAELVEPVIQSFTGVAQHKGVRLLSSPSVACNVWGDRAMLRRVLENLLDNSMRYTPVSGRVQVTTNYRDGIEVLVANDGPGIASSDRARIFEKFARGSSEIRLSGSAGLGLYFCKCALEANGGDISLLDDPQWSTCFRIHLPQTS